MLYSFPVSPSIVFVAPCRVKTTRHGNLHCARNNENNMKKENSP